MRNTVSKRQRAAPHTGWHPKKTGTQTEASVETSPYTVLHDEEEDEEGSGGKKLSKHTVNAAINSGQVSHWSLQALVSWCSTAS